MAHVGEGFGEGCLTLPTKNYDQKLTFKNMHYFPMSQTDIVQVRNYATTHSSQTAVKFPPQ